MFDETLEKVNKRSILIFISFLLIAGIIFAFSILNMEEGPEAYFIDVGQGDAELLNIDGVQILIDGGPPNGRLLDEISQILPFHDRYIDLVVVSHPQLDHFGGLVEVVKRYKVGAVLYTGRKSDSQTAGDFERYLSRNNIKGLKIAKGDSIRYKDLYIEVLLPDKKTIESEDLNDSSVVLLAQLKNTSILFTGDIGSSVERKLIDVIENIDILKVAHHGSRYSSDLDFIKSIKPKVSFIEVGDNAYGHPTDEVLERLESIGSRVFRSDINGTSKVLLKDDSFQVFTKK